MGEGLILLSKVVRASLVVDVDSGWMIEEEFKILSEDIATLRGNVRAIVPADFKCGMFFEEDGLHLHFRFEDGNSSFESQDTCFTIQDVMIEKLRSVNWESLRALLTTSGGRLEELVQLAADRPPAIPSSKEAASLCAAELRDMRRTYSARKPVLGFRLVAGREDLGIGDHLFETRSALIHALTDLMPSGHHILAISQGERWWTFEEIETAKAEAVELCGPVSRAKAERRILPEDYNWEPINVWPFSELEGACLGAMEWVRPSTPQQNGGGV